MSLKKWLIRKYTKSDGGMGGRQDRVNRYRRKYQKKYRKNPNF